MKKETNSFKPKHLYVVYDIHPTPTASMDNPRLLANCRRDSIILKLTPTLWEKVAAVCTSTGNFFESDSPTYAKSELELDSVLVPILEQLVDFDVDTEYIAWRMFQITEK